MSSTKIARQKDQVHVAPITHSKVQPSPQDDESEQQKKELKRHKRASVSIGCDLKPLTSGQTVRMQPINGSREWKEGTVIKPLTTRSYEVVANGRTYVRNRRHLRARPSASTHTSPTMAGYQGASTTQRTMTPTTQHQQVYLKRHTARDTRTPQHPIVTRQQHHQRPQHQPRQRCPSPDMGGCISRHDD